MHYSTPTGLQRQLSSSDVDAGVNVVSYSINPDGAPCLPPMTQLFPTNCITDINEVVIGNTDIHLFPNPNNGSFLVSIESESETHASLSITNSFGQSIGEEEVWLKQGKNQYPLQFSNLKSGIYFIRFIYNGNVTNKKFIIE